jgi:hypothetical protein
MQSIPYLHGAEVQQSASDTLVALVDRDEPVKLSFFGGLDLGQVAPPDAVDGPGFSVASLLDLAGTKVAVVTQRAELRDYVDIYTLLTRTNIQLPDMLAAAAIIYGEEFNPIISLKALAYHEDQSLTELSFDMRRTLTSAVQNTDPAKLPALSAIKIKSGRP